ncbi:MAG: arabinofuranosyltransferase [Patescibacteria group bacterium]
MAEFSLTTIKILAGSKIVLLVYLLLLWWSWRKRARPVVFLALTALAIIIFYIVLAIPCQRMWWGTTGDELYIAAFLQQVLSGHLWSDFYYAYLPTFYPPLYFWLTGGLAALLSVHNAIVATKIGIVLTLASWFFVSYFAFKLFWSKIYKYQDDRPAIISQPWFWWLLPTIYLLLLDFDTILLKPYEAVSALFMVIWLMLWSHIFSQSQWPKKYYWCFGLSGAILFLLFYFWWLIIIPVLLLLIVGQKDRAQQLKRLFWVGIIIFLAALPYLFPIFLSGWRYGWENWLATFFVPSDFFTFNPWSLVSIRGFLWLAGLLGLLWTYHQAKHSRACLWALVACYLYQALGLVFFIFGTKPLLPAKPFMFLGSALVAVGLSQILVYTYQYYQTNKPKYLSIFVIAVSLILVTQLPMIKFVDNQNILHQLEKDLVAPQATLQLADTIRAKVPDYQQRTWLSSGLPELNAYLPLSYYIVYSPHFSHPAAVYSQRLRLIEDMALATSSLDFMKIIAQGKPRPIDALLLYNDPNDPQFYTLFFWQDKYPNGGQESQIYLAKNLISDQDWQLIDAANNWLIFIKK